MPYLEKHCRDLNLWKSQTDYTFGFVPLNNWVMPDVRGHITDKVHGPIEQHLKIRPTCIPNFLGERISVRLWLNVSEWKKIVQKLLGSTIKTIN